MKKLIALSVFLCCTLCSFGQSERDHEKTEGSRLYSSFEKYRNGEFEVIPSLDLRWKDKKRRIPGDGDYVISKTVNKDDIDIAKEMLLVEYSGTLLINCNLIRNYIGSDFAPALAIQDKIYFWSFPGGGYASDRPSYSSDITAGTLAGGIIGGLITVAIIDGRGVLKAANGEVSGQVTGTVPEQSTTREIKYYDQGTQRAFALTYDEFFEMLEPYKELKEACLDEMMQQHDINKLEVPTVWRYLGLLKQRCGTDTTAISGQQEQDSIHKL